MAELLKGLGYLGKGHLVNVTEQQGRHRRHPRRYKDKMDIFFQSNPGMGSRIAHHIDFPDYNLDELMAIAELMLKEQEYELSDDARKAFGEYLGRRMEQPRFANGRSARNALERRPATTARPSRRKPSTKTRPNRPADTTAARGG